MDINHSFIPEFIDNSVIAFGNRPSQMCKHACCVIDEKNYSFKNKLSFGTNEGKYKSKTIHAETNAFDKLKKNYEKKAKYISVVVIKVNYIHNKETFRLANSKPCSYCIEKMDEIAHKKNYRISNIYYSNSDGTITVTDPTNSLETKKKINALLFFSNIYIRQTLKNGSSKIFRSSSCWCIPSKP